MTVEMIYRDFGESAYNHYFLIKNKVRVCIHKNFSFFIIVFDIFRARFIHFILLIVYWLKILNTYKRLLKNFLVRKNLQNNIDFHLWQKHCNMFFYWTVSWNFRMLIYTPCVIYSAIGAYFAHIILLLMCYLVLKIRSVFDARVEMVFTFFDHLFRSR